MAATIWGCAGWCAGQGVRVGSWEGCVCGGESMMRQTRQQGLSWSILQRRAEVDGVFSMGRELPKVDGVDTFHPRS